MDEALHYKQRLTDRFLELLDDFKCIDRELAFLLKTSNVEDLGKKIAEAHKILMDIKESSTTLGDAHTEKKSKYKRTMQKLSKA